MATGSLPPSAEAAAHISLEAKLRELGLGVDQISQQNATDLQQSLRRLDDCIRSADFNKIAVQIPVREYPSGEVRELAFQVGTLPRLLERKQLILERLSGVAADAKVTQLLSVVEQQTASPQRNELQKQITELRAEAQRFRSEAEAAANAQRRAEEEQRGRLYEVEVFERRSKVWQRLLERESVATVLGAIMLVGMLIFICALSVAGRPIPDIINNTFMIILGYFFGQTVARVTKKEPS